MNHHALILVFSHGLVLIATGCDSPSGNRVDSTVVERSRENGTTEQPRNKPAIDGELDDDAGPILGKQRKGAQPLTRAPAELLAILRQYKSAVDFRFVAQDGHPHLGCHWRMVLNDEVLVAHVKLFDLQPSSKGRLTEKLLREFPSEWPDISGGHIQWYAWPYNRDDSDRLQLWSVMAVDVEASTLYFFHQNFDVTG